MVAGNYILKDMKKAQALRTDDLNFTSVDAHCMF